MGNINQISINGNIYDIKDKNVQIMKFDNDEGAIETNEQTYFKNNLGHIVGIIYSKDNTNYILFGWQDKENIIIEPNQIAIRFNNKNSITLSEIIRTIFYSNETDALKIAETILSLSAPNYKDIITLSDAYTIINDFNKQRIIEISNNNKSITIGNNYNNLILKNKNEDIIIEKDIIRVGTECYYRTNVITLIINDLGKLLNDGANTTRTLNEIYDICGLIPENINRINNGTLIYLNEKDGNGVYKVNLLKTGTYPNFECISSNNRTNIKFLHSHDDIYSIKKIEI